VVVLVAGAVYSVAVSSNRLTAKLRVPAPGLFLVAAAIIATYVPGADTVVPIKAVEQVVTVALAVILFDGGMHIGWRRFKAAAAPIISLGIIGTFATTAAMAFLAHSIFDFSWPLSFVIGAALAPTDPAVVFSVLGPREVAGRSGTILEGESGANDPAGIALMLGVIAYATSGHTSAAEIGVTFVKQMGIGAAVGVTGGLLLLQLVRRVPLPNEGLYPLRTLASALTLYGLASVADGSGFLAVLVAGVVMGDAQTPYKGEIERFHSSLASLAEITAFVLLGLTIHVDKLGAGNAWVIGLVLAALLTFVVRPLATLPMLMMTKLSSGERAFVAFAGLKGAVPVLLGALAVTGGVDDATRIYAVIFVVVALSVFLQGGAIPFAARLCRVHMRVIEQEPWSLGVRLREEPGHARRFLVADGALVEGRPIGDLPFGEKAWVSIVIRNGKLLSLRPDTTLEPGDEALVLSDDDHFADVERAFGVSR
jgi:cell volume regulation protein A